MHKTFDHRSSPYLKVDPASAYGDLKHFFSALPAGFKHPEILQTAATPLLARFLEERKGWQAIERIRRNTRDQDAFIWGVHTWFDSLKIVQWAHFAREDRGSDSLFDAIDTLYPPAMRAELPSQPLSPASVSISALNQWLDILREWRPAVETQQVI